MTLLYENTGQKKSDKTDKTIENKVHLTEVRSKSTNDQIKSKTLLKSSESHVIDAGEHKKPWRIPGTRSNELSIRPVTKSKGEKASEGVQDLIRHVSVFLEDKNPFKKHLENNKVKHREQEKISRMPVKTESIVSRQEKFENLTKQKVSIPVRCGKPTRNTVSKENPQERDPENKKLVLPKNIKAKKSSALLTLGFKDNMKEGKDESIEKENPKFEKSSHDEEVIVDSGMSDPNLKQSQTDSEVIEPLDTSPKIPRSEVTTEAESLSLLLQNYIEAVDSNVSVDMSKTIGLTMETSPDQEDGILENVKPTIPQFCDSYQTAKDCSSQNLDNFKSILEESSAKFLGDEDVNFELKKTLEVPNIPFASSLEVTDSSSVTIKKTKKLDLNRINSSKVALLVSSEALQKLESFHKKNMSSSTRLKQLTSKTSFSSLTAEKSKKNLLNSRGIQSSKSLKVENNSAEISTITKGYSMQNLLRTSKQINAKVSSDDPEKIKRASKPSSQRSNRSLGSPATGNEKPPTGRERTFKSVTRLENECRGILTFELFDGKPEETPFRPELNTTRNVYDCLGGDDSFKLFDGDSEMQNEPNDLSKFFDDLTEEPSFMKVSEIRNTEEKQIESTNAKMGTKTLSPNLELDSTSNKISKQLPGTGEYKKLSQKVPRESNKKSFDKSQESYHKSSRTIWKTMPHKNPKDLNNLIVRGTHIPIKEKKEVSKVSASEKKKLEITIDLKAQDDVSEQQPTTAFEDKIVQKKEPFEPKPEVDETKENISSTCNITEVEGKLLTDDQTVLEPSGVTVTTNAVNLKPYKSSSFLKKKSKLKMSMTRIKGRPKKIKPEPINRSLLTPSGHFSSVTSFISKSEKAKLEAKIRNNMKKSFNQEGLIDDDLSYLFDDVAAANLRRRNSEPNSFKGFVWKQPELAIFKGNKTSASSMTSSLRHMNTDELEDFRVWEAAPLKMTSCWEMSLYHCKRPWSVLSCSVFKDNRLANAPGIILENLRTGGTLDFRCPPLFFEKERISGQTTNALDIEPSVAQKNIDINNWLSTLNFSTPPTTSSDVISEGNFLSTISIGSPKNQMTPKRRKFLRAINYSEEALKQKFEDNRSLNKSNDLMDLIRRKSGGFVAVERNKHYTMPNNSRNLVMISQESQTHRLRVSPNLDLLKVGSDDLEAVLLREEAGKEELLKKNGDSKLESLSKDAVPETLIKLEVKSRSGIWGGLIKFFKGETDINIWKYLFILSLSIILYHFYYANFETLSSTFNF